MSDHQTPKTRLAVDWAGLEDAQSMLSAGHEVDLGLRCFLDRETGKVVSLMDSAFAARRRLLDWLDAEGIEAANPDG